MPHMIRRAVIDISAGDDPTPRPISGHEALRCEWLEADGLGGFASGTAAGIRTRRYHALVLVATHPPADRFVLVQGVEAWIDLDNATHALTSNIYEGDVVYPDGISRLRAFTATPWPTWRHELPDGTIVVAELVVVRDRGITVLTWTRVGGRGLAGLRVRPMLGARDPHALHLENPEHATGVAVHGRQLVWPSYREVPRVIAATSGSYEHAPEWFHNVLYPEERARGLDAREDLFSPGEITFDLGAGPAHLVLGSEAAFSGIDPELPGASVAERLRAEERARRSAGARELARASYLARRGDAPAIVAGFPWFGEWGRDTFLAMRGLCLATGRLDEAAALLSGWVDTIDRGMVPNRLPDRGVQPEYNSVDASLWYGVVVFELLAACERAGHRLAAGVAAALLDAVDRIVAGFQAGTRHGIRIDDDGLVAAGEPGVQLTWMDAKVGDWVVTPRIGKPVEVQALWLNLLGLGRVHRSGFAEAFERGRATFVARFVAADRDHLADVVDVDHEAGRVDASVRPNQVYALGGLPIALVDRDVAARALAVVERDLWVPIGLRTLAPHEPGYVGRYEGGVAQRDAGYHQGTVWPHLLGAFVDAWTYVHGDGDAQRDEARRRFLAPLRAHLGEAGLGHVSEIADGDPPHTPRGAPFQAWGLGELLRIEARLAAAEASR